MRHGFASKTDCAACREEDGQSDGQYDAAQTRGAVQYFALADLLPEVDKLPKTR